MIGQSECHEAEFVGYLSLEGFRQPVPANNVLGL
jgi:hypothetical protein